MRVRDLTSASTKFGTNGAAGANNYKSGVMANTDWAGNTAAAASTWQQGVTAPGAATRFSGNVTKAGQGKWQSRAAGTGQQRFSQAMSDPQTKQNWVSGFTPFAQVLTNLTLGPRGVTGSPNNLQRVTQIANALHAAKVGSAG